jgi:hypothetical protein
MPRRRQSTRDPCDADALGQADRPRDDLAVRAHDRPQVGREARAVELLPPPLVEGPAIVRARVGEQRRVLYAGRAAGDELGLELRDEQRSDAAPGLRRVDVAVGAAEAGPLLDRAVADHAAGLLDDERVPRRVERPPLVLDVGEARLVATDERLVDRADETRDLHCVAGFRVPNEERAHRASPAARAGRAARVSARRSPARRDG